MTNDAQSHQLKAGDRFELMNHGSKGLKITIDIEDGAKIVVSLHPGAQIATVVGTSGMTFTIDDADVGASELTVVSSEA